VSEKEIQINMDISESGQSSSDDEDTPLKTLVDFSLSSADKEDESILTHSSSTDDSLDECSRLPETKDHYCRFNNRRLEQYGKDNTPETPPGDERHFTMFYSGRQAEYKLMQQKRKRVFYNKDRIRNISIDDLNLLKPQKVSKDKTKWTHSGKQWLDYLRCHIVESANSSTSRSNVTTVMRPVHLRYDKNDPNDSIWTKWDKKGKKPTKKKKKEIQNDSSTSSSKLAKPRNPHERLPNVNHLAYRVAHPKNALPAKISDQAKKKKKKKPPPKNKKKHKK